MTVISLSDDQIRAAAPSVFATHPAPSVSDRYAYIPTYPALRQLRTMGLQPVMVREAVKRAPDGKQFALHEVRFRKVEDQHWMHETRELGQLTPEVVLRNSHDRTSTMNFSAGLHRLVCLNGMTVMEAGSAFSVRHLGRNTSDQVHAAVTSIIGHFASSVETARLWSGIQMSAEMRRRFALGAIAIRGTSLQLEYPLDILRPKRTIDVGEDLWRVFNRAQENLTRGVRVDFANHGGSHRLQSVGSLTKDVELNRRLWSLASDFAREVEGELPVVGEAALA